MLLDPDLFKAKLFRLGISGQMLQQIALGGMMIALPIYLQMVLEYNAMKAGLSIAPLSLSMFGMALLAGQQAPATGGRPSSSAPDSRSSPRAWSCSIPIVPRADSGWYLVIPLLIAGSGLGLLVSQLNNYTLAPISEERVSEAAGVNSAGGSFGLSFGLAFGGAIMLATLSFSFTNQANDSKVLTPAQQQQVSDTLEHDAQVMSNTQLQQQVSGESPAVQAEIIRINTDARHRALQVALLVPIIAAALGPARVVPHAAPAGSRVIRIDRRRRLRLIRGARAWIHTTPRDQRASVGIPAGDVQDRGLAADVVLDADVEVLCRRRRRFRRSTPR